MPQPNDSSRLRAANKILRVTFPDGKVICCNRASETLVETLKTIGSHRFHEIKLEVGRHPLLSQEIFPQFKGFTKEVCDGWYIISRSDSKEKYHQLRCISNELNLGLKLELAEKFDSTSQAVSKAARGPKQKLAVTFPDGECIACHSSSETFIETIKKIGASKIAARQNIVAGGHPLFTHTKDAFHTIEIDSHHWLATTATTAERRKLLTIISNTLGLHLQIEVR